MRAAAFLAAALWLALAAPAAAQEGGPGAIDYDAWESVATRAEAAVEAGRASDSALESLRTELVGWRERFLAGQDENAARIDTLRSQIEALGPAPAEGETEAPELAARRELLSEQLAAAEAPAVRAEEAHSRAGGIVREIDRIIRERQATTLFLLGPSPLAPGSWATAAGEVGDVIQGAAAATGETLASDVRRQGVRNALPRILLYAALALALLVRGRRLVAAARDAVHSQLGARARTALAFPWSVGGVAAPIVGAWFAAEAISATGLLGLQGTAVVAALPGVGAAAFGFHWLGQELFRGDGGAAADPAQAGAIRRSATALGLLVGLASLLEALAGLGDLSAASVAVLYLPVAALAALALFGLGLALVHLAHGSAEEGDEDSPAGGSRWLGLLGRASQAFAVAGAVLVAVGYLGAGLYVLFPAIGSLALIALLAAANRAIREIHSALADGDAEGARPTLVPTLLGLALAVASLPAFALIWGARTADLHELWTRFRDGFTVGEARVSPENFLIFLVVFVALYIATRVVQGALRNNVLPKTRIDAGGRNAIVSGVGYVGIFVAAVVAISTAGIDLSSVAIVAGALSVGIGFGLQTVVQNFVSGIILLIERPVAEGDWVQVGSTMGIVKKVSVRSTMIETFDKVDVIVPNGDLISSPVQNWTRKNTIGRVIVTVSVAYGTDTRKVEGILREIAAENPLVSRDPEPGVDFLQFGADGLEFRVRAVLHDVNQSLAVKNEMHHRIAERFGEEGIEIPFAQRDLWLRNPEALRGPGADGAAEAGGTPRGGNAPGDSANAKGDAT